MIQALLVGLTVVILGFIECWCCFPMVERPLIVGTAIGIVLGDVKTGVEVGASLELVFMGVMEQYLRMQYPVRLWVQHMQSSLGQVLKQHLHWQYLHLLFARCSLYRRLHCVPCIHLLSTEWQRREITKGFKGFSHQLQSQPRCLAGWCVHWGLGSVQML